MDDPEGLSSTEKETGVPTFSVSENVLDALNLKHGNGHPFEKKDIARPALVLLDRDGNVLWMSVSPNYRVRPDPEKVLEEVKAVLGGKE